MKSGALQALDLGGPLRAHAGPNALGVDSTTRQLGGTNLNPLTKNNITVVVSGSTPGTEVNQANTTQAVIDAMWGPPSAMILGGRQDGSMYDYRFNSLGTQPGPVSGGGFFLATYTANGANPILQSVLLIGGTPLKPASDISSGPDEGIALSNRCLAFAYTGTVNLGTGPLVAPSTGHAIVISDYVAKPSAPSVFSYSKGPASAGKTGTPHCVLGLTGASFNQPGSGFFLVDTIWDSITIGTDVVNAVHAGGDVLVAKIDATGKLLHARLYGGPGAVRGSGITSGSNNVVVAGQSDSGIDFGNGVLPAGAFIASLPL